ncbi:MAG: mechanosensitive ion channel domain-containing protein [Planctomycetota bacterium]
MKHRWSWIWLFGWLSGTAVVAQVDNPRPGGDSSGEGRRAASDQGEPVQDRVSDAERIARLQRTIDETEQEIAGIRKVMSDPKSDFKKAESAFADIDGDYQQRKTEFDRLRDEGKRDQAAKVEAELGDLEKRWSLAKERFDLAIKERRATQDKLLELEARLQQDREVLAKLTAGIDGSATARENTAAAEPLAGKDAGGGAATESRGLGAATLSGQPPASVGQPVATPPTAPTAPIGSLPVPPGSAGQTADSPASAPGTVATPQDPPSEELLKAQADATTKEAAAQEAELEARTIAARAESLRKSISGQRELLRIARQKADNAQETQRALDEELQKRWDAGAKWSELSDLRRQIEEQKSLAAAARAQIRGATDRLDKFQSELDGLQTETIGAMELAEGKRREAEAARKEVDRLNDPFARENIIRWLKTSGVKILATLLGMFVLLRLSRVIEARVVRIMSSHGGAGSAEDRENRAQTLVGVFHNAASVVIIVGGGLTALSQAGVDIVPLLGGAAVIGFAAGLGAQNLIRDYFYGFIILLENQYAINDFIRIGGTEGKVERITLRMSVLRDLEGVVHFVPHGHITTVSNVTHGWSLAVLNIDVAYKEDVDQVMKVLMELANELRRDNEFGGLILNEPEMLGVDQFGESAITIKFVLKTRPLKQWIVRRELQRRIKRRFDELGIEIPFPQRVIHHRHVGSDVPDSRREDPPEWAASRPGKSR